MISMLAQRAVSQEARTTPERETACTPHAPCAWKALHPPPQLTFFPLGPLRCTDGAV